MLAGRDAPRLEALAQQLGASTQRSLTPAAAIPSALAVDRGDVLISTVGPSARYGEPAVEAAIAAARSAPRADLVPGNLAGALALRDAGDSATRVDVGYLTPGRFATSGGTKASAAGVILEPGFIWRSGHLVTERQAARVRSFRGRSAEKPRCRSRSEHLALPRLHPGLGDVRAYVGTFEAATRPMQALSALGPTLMRRPRPRRATSRFVKGSTGGPDANARTKVHFLRRRRGR